MDDIIKQVNSPDDLKKFDYAKLNEYCAGLREYISETVRRTGGHLASSLGAVELAVALHYVFNCPTDKILWDVGHQAYAHKIITGRAQRFADLRRPNGISGFPKMSESEYDSFTMGHSSTSLSVGLGYARARDALGENYNIVSVIGDGAFTGGMAFEALNDIGAAQAKMIIVLNDNKMSISENVGALSEYFSKLRLSNRYSKLKRTVKNGVLGIPFIGEHIYKAIGKTKDGIKTLLQNNKMFEQMGIKYFGPIDGHDLSNLIELLRQVKKEEGPTIIHIITEKGKGDSQARSDPSKYHGLSAADSETKPEFSRVLSDFLLTEGARNNRIVAITAAMAYGTGLTEFGEKFPKRCYDVGIAEQHAVTLAAGLAAGGLKPYFAVYSTFLQRGFDQIIHDVCLNNLAVTFVIDRAGAVGADGVTHQGIYDLSYLSLIPNLTVLAPKDGKEFYEMLKWSVCFDGPLAIRYPKNYSRDGEFMPIEAAKWQTLKACKKGVYVLAAGARAVEAAMGTEQANIINARFIKPLDEPFLRGINKKGNVIVTVEDNALKGGFGSSVLSYLNAVGLNAKITSIGYGDSFLEDMSVEHSLFAAGISKDGITNAIQTLLKK